MILSWEMRNPELAAKALPMATGIALDFYQRIPKYMDRNAILSEAIFGLVTAADRFEPARGGFRPFARTHIRGRLVDHVRAHMNGRKEYPVKLVRFVDKYAGRDNQHDTAIEREVQRTLALHIDKLPSRTRKIIWLRFFPSQGPLTRQLNTRHDIQGLTQAGIASRLGLTEARVSQLEREALARLRNSLKRAGIKRVSDVF